MELRDDLEKILLGGLDADERKKTLNSMREEDARQLRRARERAEQWNSGDHVSIETDEQPTGV